VPAVRAPRAVTKPPLTVGVATAPLDPPPPEMVTDGAVTYPEPALVSVTELIATPAEEEPGQ